MAKSCNQKSKILYLEKMLNESAGGKPITMQEILSTLEEHGIRAERKSIYDDMETLREFGMEIQYKRGREGGYYLERSADPEIQQGKSVQEEKKTEATETVKTEVVKTEVVKTEVVKTVAPEIPVKGEKELKLLCRNSVKEKIFDTFGKDISCKAKGSDNFFVVVQTEPDEKFYGWLTSMGRTVHIVKPKKVAIAYRDYLKSIARDYKGIEK